jgi:uncharacterized protein (DUF1015 family)
MPRVSPFQGLIFDERLAGPLEHVTAPPYDVISDARREELLAASPFSVVHLDLAEGPQDPAHPRSRYARAAQLLADWRTRGVVVPTPASSFYAYEMTFGAQGEEQTVRGLLAAMDLEPWGGSVVPHEDVMPGPVEDRLQLLRRTRTHLSPIYGTITGPCAPLAEWLAEHGTRPPMLALTDERGVTHRVWPMDEPGAIAELLAPESLLIADGHHRYTTALSYRDERHALDGPGPWDRLPVLVVDAAAQRLPVLPFHRIQISGPAPTAGEAVADLHAALAALSDDELRVATVTVEGQAPRYRVIELPGRPPAVRALHEGPLRDTPSERLRFVSDAAVANAAVTDGDAVAAWFLPPTTPARIRAIVERGERLPQKSTYFWPKPRTGMVMMPLDGALVEPA